MRVEPSKLARLVVAYHEKFGRHVPASALRVLDAGDLVPILQDALATGAPLPETGWDSAPPIGFSPPRGCCIVCEESEQQTPGKEPDDEWLQ
jgi:hypothetical protein